jgi:LysR substrate binding domain
LTSQLHAEVTRGDLDLAVCLDDPSSKVRAIPLYREFLYLIGPVSARDAREENIALADLVNYPLVVGPRSHVARLKHLAARATRL